MRLKIISSNSSGNCYLLQAKDATLILECGVPFAEIKSALNHDLSSVVGCLVSHEHKDHCKSVRDLLRSGIEVYSGARTHREMKTEGHHNSRNMFAGSPGREIGSFKVISFNVQHDAAQPFGFLIQHPESGTILFATDTYYLRYRFSNLNNVIIEANYCEEILERRRRDGSGNTYVSDRVISSHMSLQQCVQTLSDNDISEVNNIVLIHLSDGNSDARRFEDTIRRATLKNVHIADKGMDINLDKYPF